MALTRNDVEQIANLARLELTGTQTAMYQQQLSDILNYADMLDQLDLEGVEPTTQAVTMRNVLRADVVETTLTMDEVLANAPQKANNQFVIQAVLDE